MYHLDRRIPLKRRDEMALYCHYHFQLIQYDKAVGDEAMDLLRHYGTKSRTDEMDTSASLLNHRADETAKKIHHPCGDRCCCWGVLAEPERLYWRWNHSQGRSNCRGTGGEA